MSLAMGWASSVGIGEQTGATSANDSPGLWLPYCKSSISLAREQVPFGASAGEYFTSSTPILTRQALTQYYGFQDIKGALQMTVVQPSVVAELFKLWNGTVTSVLLPGSITGAPTLTVQSGGNLAASSGYYYKVAQVLQRTFDSSLFFTNISAESTVANTTGSNKKIQVAWANATIPSGFTLFGTAIWRTVANGSAGTELFLDINAGSSTSYVDDGSVALGSAVPPALMYCHTMAPAQALNAATTVLTPFTVQANMDNGYALQAVGCYADKFVFTSPAKKTVPCSLSVDVRGISANQVAISGPSYASAAEAFVRSWSASVIIGGGWAPQLESWSLTGTNGLMELTDFGTIDTWRGFYANAREVTGEMSLIWEGWDQWAALLANNAFSLFFQADAAPVTPLSNITAPAVASSWPLGCTFSIANACLTSAGGPLAGPSSIVEKVGWRAQGADSELAITCYNSLSSITA